MGECLFNRCMPKKYTLQMDENCIIFELCKELLGYDMRRLNNFSIIIKYPLCFYIIYFMYT